MGFGVGNERLIAALTRVKSYLDYGAFTPIQVAAAAALNGPQDCVDEIRDIYRARRDCVVDSIGRTGWHIPPHNRDSFSRLIFINRRHSPHHIVQLGWHYPG